MKILIGILIGIMMIVPVYSQDKANPANQKVHKVEVKEVLQTSAYTYLKVKEDTTLSWIAIPKMEAKPGEIYYTVGGMEMRNFPSKELNRTFPLVYFMDFVSKTPEGALRKNVPAQTQGSMSMPQHGTKSKLNREEIKYEPIPGGTSIAEIFKNKTKYAGKVVKVKGQVVKYNEHIMGKNWVHLQDGTSNGDEYDLVITLTDSVKPGDNVTLQGKIALDKDFGSGYFFKVLMEDAILVK